MTTGILNALRRQDSSIDELAKLPQTMIMQMAQRKEIGAEMVAPILSRKAEMADAVARTKALQNSGAPKTSIMEQLMQKTAEQQQPEPQAREMGIAQLPVKEDMYSEQGMAAGGIVAFADNQDQPVSEDMPREGESESDYLKRARAVQEAGSQFFTPRNYDPIAKLKDLYGAYDRNIGQPVAEGIKRFTSETPESQAAKFNAGANARKNISFTNAEPNTKTITSTPTQAEIDAIRATNKSPATTAATTAEPTGTAPKKMLVADEKSPSKLKAVTGGPEMPETKVDPIDAMLAKYEKMIMGNPEEAKEARRQAAWGRGAEAGLNIMGGTSPYALANIGQGGAAAMKGYSEDIKGLRAEDTARLNQLASLGLKGVALKQEAQKLGITAKHYDDWAKVQGQQNAIMAGSRSDANKLRADTATENRIKGFADSLLKLPKYMDNPELAYADAIKMVTGKSGQNQFTGFSGQQLK